MTISQLNKITTPVLWDIETKYYENNDYLWTTKRKITMNDLLCKLPIGIQTFEKLRKGDYLYVDKTELVWKIAYISTPYFLSRPRRFGKSLLLSTFEAYFEGKKERKNSSKGLPLKSWKRNRKSILSASGFECREVRFSGKTLWYPQPSAHLMGNPIWQRNRRKHSFQPFFRSHPSCLRTNRQQRRSPDRWIRQTSIAVS